MACPLSRSAADVLTNQPQHFAGVGVAAELTFGEHQRAIDGDLEDAARRLNQPYLRPRIGISDLGLQTGGPGEIPSDTAILNRDAHGVPLTAVEVVGR